MNRLRVNSLIFAAMLVLTMAGTADLLRFSNGDQLHGSFAGLKDGPQVLWKRDDITGTVDFKTSQIRHAILRSGPAANSLKSLSHLTLVDGDRIPGTLTGMDSDSVTIDTSYAGPLRIPRNQIAMLAPSPLGGRVFYHGPFIKDEWRMAHPSHPDGMPPEAPAELGHSKKKNDSVGRWSFSGSSWYWPNKKSGTALLKDDGMPDRAILRFDLAWKNRLAMVIGFHADFAKPKLIDDAADGKGRPLGFAPGDSSALPHLFGNSYVLQIFSTHMMLFRTWVTEQGAPQIERLQVHGNAVRLGDTGKATLEIRSNRNSGEISLFVNGEFVMQWSETVNGALDEDRFARRGNGFGFVVQTEDAPLRISDIIVAEWNGMPDSARSLQTNEQDVVLLANGTDRFAGKVNSLENEVLGFETKYGRFDFPLSDIAEVRFALKELAQETEPPSDRIIIRFNPIGQISGRPVAGTPSSITLVNPIYGKIDCNLDAAVMLDFQPSTNFIDDWESDF
jgi:hypothetical protein